MMQPKKTATERKREREKEQTGRESVLKERRESARRKESRFFLLSLTFFSSYFKRKRERELA